MRDLMNEIKVRLIICKKNILYMCLLQKKKKIPVIIKQFKNIINTNKFSSSKGILYQGDISAKTKGKSLPYCNNY